MPVREFNLKYAVLLPEAGLPGDSRAERSFRNRGEEMNLSPPLLVCETPIHVVDWMPTLLAAADVPAPQKHTLDGVSLLPLLRGESIAARPLYWYMPLYDLRWAATPCAVLREGDWKLIEYFGDWFDEEPRYHAGQRSELYNLRADLGEARNLADTKEDRAIKMRSQIHAWLRSIPALIPETNPHFDAAKMLEETKEKQPWN